MTSEIRKATEKERGLAVKFLDEADHAGKNLLDQAEDIGFRVIYEEGEKNHLPILLPSGGVLDWDFVPNSLDALTHNDPREIENAAIYLTLVSIPYLKKQGVDIPQSLL